MSNRLLTIWRFNSGAEAHLYKAKLELEGIRAVVIHDNPSGVTQYVELQVRENDAEKASKIVSSIYKAAKIKKQIHQRDYSFIYLIIGCIFVGITVAMIIITSSLAGAVICSIAGIWFISLFILSKIND